MNPKPWYKSATALALGASFLTHLAGWAGVPLPAALAHEFAEYLLPAAGMAFDAIALWGRSRARGPLTMTQDGADRAQLLRLPWFVAIAAAALVAATLPACKTIDQHQASASLVVKYATMKVIEQAGATDAQFARATRIRSIAADVEKFAGGEAVTIAALEAAVRAQLPSDLSPADRFLADALVQSVVQELQARVGSGLLNPEQLLQVRQVLGWVIEATSYVAPPVQT
jgi:hypothetical protein